MSGPAKRHPCDQCRRRKVRCNYVLPCDRCQSHHLPCTFNSVRKRKGPKPGRGTVIDLLRPQSQHLPTTPSMIGNGDLDQSQAANGEHISQQEITSASTTSNDNVGGDTVFGVSGQARQDYRETQSSPSSTIYDAYFTFDEFAQNVLSSSFLDDNRAWTQNQFEPAPTRPSFAARDLLPSTPGSMIDHELLDWQEVSHGVKLFFDQMYVVYPIVDEQTTRSLLVDPGNLQRAEARLLWSMCALTLMSVDSWPGKDLDHRASLARKYIRRCLEARVPINCIENATTEDVLTSLFIAVTYFDLKCRKTAWFYVREAITLAQAAGMHVTEGSSKLGSADRIRKQRIYALLYITERGACIHDTFPLSMLVAPTLSHEILPGEDPTVSTGLSMLFHVFSLLDFNFVRFWSDSSNANSSGHDYSELVTLQEQLRQHLDLTGVSETQRADVLITQQWLRLMVWQTALRLGLISSAASDPAYSYSYPIDIALSLCEALKTLSPASIEVHGLGIFEKQFEIAYSLLDALTFSSHTHPAQHHDTLRSLLQSLSASPKSRDVYVRILQKRMGQDEARRPDQRYVHLADVQLLVDDRSIRERSRRESIADNGSGHGSVNTVSELDTRQPGMYQ